MLQLNVNALLRERGIDQPGSYLVQKGMKYHTANRLLTRKVLNLTYDTIEQLCLLCNCTPDDLFVWQPDDAATVPADHPLHKLKPKKQVVSPVERLRRLSPEQMEQLNAFMDGLEKGEGKE